MIVPVIPKYRKRRGREKRTTATTPTALTLISAAYEVLDPPVVTLAFDRAVDLAAFDGGNVVVNDDQTTGILWVGNGGWEQPTPASVRVTLLPAAVADPGPVTLRTPAPTGIVAADGGDAWAGVSDLELPFP